MVIDIAASLSVPSRTLSKGASGFFLFLCWRHAEVHLGASSSSALGPPGVEPQSGAGLDTMPRERPAITIQSLDVPVLLKDIRLL